jgi:hypothetical protein
MGLRVLDKGDLIGPRHHAVTALPLPVSICAE